MREIRKELGCAYLQDANLQDRDLMEIKKKYHIRVGKNK